MIEDTIAAIATPPGCGGVGIVKISGAQSLSIVSNLFGKTKEKPDFCCSAFESHRVVHGYVFNSETGFVIDEVLLVPMLAPRSYTREDIVEIQAHSGNIVLSSILEEVIKNGARLAEPGEFTKRAFLNGRIDLTQAEAVADIINAKSIKALKLAASQNLGSLGSIIEEARIKLIDLLSFIEVGIDFPEDENIDEIVFGDKAADTIQEILVTCRNAVKLYENAHFLRDGIKLVICGKPNVGKSSLMNRLIEKERSIVTSFPGTTRDLIEETLNIDGIPFIISDTAGLHDTEDPVEKIGIERARQNIADADVVLYMIEAGASIISEEISSIITCDKKIIFVINKIDLIADEGFIPDLPEEFKKNPVVNISALYNKGIDVLKKTIMDISTGDMEVKSTIVPNLRHKIALTRVIELLESAKKGILGGKDEILVSMDVKKSAELLGEITGHSVDIDILDSIFKNFCIGK